MNKSAADLMTGNVVVVDEDTPISSVIETFDENSITAAPVVDSSKALVGIVTKSDLFGFYMDTGIKTDIQRNLSELIELELDPEAFEAAHDPDTPVKNIMTPEPITAQEDTPADVLARTIIEERIHKVIILRGKEIAGIISPTDFLYPIAGIQKK